MPYYGNRYNRSYYQPPAAPQAKLGPYKWPSRTFDQRDRYVLSNILARRGWVEAIWSFKLFAKDASKLTGAEARLAAALWPEGSLNHWHEAELYVELRILKAPGKAQQLPEYWVNNPNAEPTNYYGLQGGLLGILPRPGAPAIGVYPNIDWKAWREKRYYDHDQAPEVSADAAADALTKGSDAPQIVVLPPYSERPLPNCKGWRVRHSKSGNAGKYSGQGSEAACQLVKGLDQDPMLRHVIGIVRPTDPLADIFTKHLEQLYLELATTANHIVNAAKIVRGQKRFTAKKVRDEILAEG